jgi:hypothetical protein
MPQQALLLLRRRDFVARAPVFFGEAAASSMSIIDMASAANNRQAVLHRSGTSRNTRVLHSL